MIGRSGERGSGISALAARHDDDDDSPSRQGKKLGGFRFQFGVSFIFSHAEEL